MPNIPCHPIAMDVIKVEAVYHYHSSLTKADIKGRGNHRSQVERVIVSNRDSETSDT